MILPYLSPYKFAAIVWAGRYYRPPLSPESVVRLATDERIRQIVAERLAAGLTVPERIADIARRSMEAVAMLELAGGLAATLRRPPHDQHEDRRLMVSFDRHGFNAVLWAAKTSGRAAVPAVQFVLDALDAKLAALVADYDAHGLTVPDEVRATVAQGIEGLRQKRKAKI